MQQQSASKQKKKREIKIDNRHTAKLTEEETVEWKEKKIVLNV